MVPQNHTRCALLNAGIPLVQDSVGLTLTLLLLLGPPLPLHPIHAVPANPRSAPTPDASTMQVNTAKHYFDSHSSAPGEHRTAKLNLFHRLAMRSATLRRRDLLHTLQVRQTRTSAGPSRVAYGSHAVSASECIVGGGNAAPSRLQ